MTKTPSVVEASEPAPYILKTEAVELMLGHFPVQKVSSFGLLGSYCLCGVHFGSGFSYPTHVVALLEGSPNDSVVN